MSAENAATADVQAFEAACAALTEAESALRRAQELACELEAKADQLDREAAELDQQRGRALARGKMDDVRKIGQKWEGAHDGAKAARAEASALRTAIKKVAKALEAKDKPNAQQAFKEACATIDRYAGKGLIHKNNAARQKSSLNKRVRALA